jgi:hypothetical protein
MRKLIFILLILIGLTAHSQVVMYWPLISNTLDYSGTGINGTATGATNAPNTGIRGGSYLFDASLERIASVSLALTTGTNVSLEMWINPVGQKTTLQTIFQRGSGSGVAQFRVLRNSNSNDLTVILGKTGGTITFTSTNYWLNTNGKQTYLVIVVDEPNKFVYFYKNGDLFSSASTADTPLAMTSSLVCLVGGTTSANQNFYGNICEVRFKDAGMTGALIKTKYITGKNKRGR